MGQYFKYLNVDKKEIVSLPSGIKLPEIMMNPKSAQVVTYLLFEGPFDGTTILDSLYDVEDERVQDEIDEFIEQEIEIEEKRKQDDELKRRCLEMAITYTDGHVYDKSDASIEDIDKFPQQIVDEYEEKLKKRVYSVYRESNLNWDRDRVRRSVCAGFYTGEDSMCGRWAGDDVRIVGDYADNDLYSAMYGTVVVKLNNGELAEWVGPHPCAEEPIDRPGPGVSARMLDRDATPGDLVRANRLDCGQDHVEFVEYKESEWDDITASVYHEMTRYMPSEFGDLADNVGEPEIVFGTGKSKH